MIGILYFSSTGNSLYIAQRVKKVLGGLIKYIPNYEGDGSEFEKIILVTPIYSYGMPTFVYDIIPRINKMTELIIYYSELRRHGKWRGLFHISVCQGTGIEYQSCLRT